MAESEARARRKARIFRIIYQQARNSMVSVRKKSEKVPVKTVFGIVAKKTKQALLVDHFVTRVGRMQRKTKLRERLRKVGRVQMGRDLFIAETTQGRQAESVEIWKALRKQVLDMRDELLEMRTEFDPEDADAIDHFQESVALLEDMEKTTAKVQRIAIKLLRLLSGGLKGYDRVMKTLEKAEHLAFLMDSQTRDLCDLEDWEPFQQFWRQQGEAKISLLDRALSEVRVIEEKREQEGEETPTSEDEERKAKRELTPKMQNLAEGMLNQLLDLRESENWREQPTSSECNNVVIGLLRSASIEDEAPPSDSDSDSSRSSRNSSNADEVRPVVIYKEDSTTRLEEKGKTEFEGEVTVPLLEKNACSDNGNTSLQKNDDYICDEKASDSADDGMKMGSERPESLDVQFQEEDLDKQDEVVPFAVQASWSREHLEPEPEKHSRWWKLRALYRGAAAFLQAKRARGSSTSVSKLDESPQLLEEPQDAASDGTESASIVKLPNIARTPSKRSNDSEIASVEGVRTAPVKSSSSATALPQLVPEAPRPQSVGSHRSQSSGLPRLNSKDRSPVGSLEDDAMQPKNSSSRRRASAGDTNVGGARRPSSLAPDFHGVIGARRHSLPVDGPRATAMGRPPRLFARRGSNSSQTAKEARPRLMIGG